MLKSFVGVLIIDTGCFQCMGHAVNQCRLGYSLFIDGQCLLIYCDDSERSYRTGL